MNELRMPTEEEVAAHRKEKVYRMPTAEEVATHRKETFMSRGTPEGPTPAEELYEKTGYLENRPAYGITPAEGFEFERLQREAVAVEALQTTITSEGVDRSTPELEKTYQESHAMTKLKLLFEAKDQREYKTGEELQRRFAKDSGYADPQQALEYYNNLYNPPVDHYHSSNNKVEMKTEDSWYKHIIYNTDRNIVDGVRGFWTSLNAGAKEHRTNMMKELEEGFGDDAYGFMTPLTQWRVGIENALIEFTEPIIEGMEDDAWNMEHGGTPNYGFWKGGKPVGDKFKHQVMAGAGQAVINIPLAFINPALALAHNYNVMFNEAYEQTKDFNKSFAYGVVGGTIDFISDRITGLPLSKLGKASLGVRIMMKLGLSGLGGGSSESLQYMFLQKLDGKEINKAELWQNFSVGGVTDLLVGGSIDTVVGVGNKVLGEVAHSRNKVELQKGLASIKVEVSLAKKAHSIKIGGKDCDITIDEKTGEVTIDTEEELTLVSVEDGLYTFENNDGLSILVDSNTGDYIMSTADGPMEVQNINDINEKQQALDDVNETTTALEDNMRGKQTPESKIELGLLASKLETQLENLNELESKIITPVTGDMNGPITPANWETMRENYTDEDIQGSLIGVDPALKKTFMDALNGDTEAQDAYNKARQYSTLSRKIANGEELTDGDREIMGEVMKQNYMDAMPTDDDLKATYRAINSKIANNRLMSAMIKTTSSMSLLKLYPTVANRVRLYESSNKEFFHKEYVKIRRQLEGFKALERAADVGIGVDLKFANRDKNIEDTLRDEVKMVKKELLEGKFLAAYNRMAKINSEFNTLKRILDKSESDEDIAQTMFGVSVEEVLKALPTKSMQMLQLNKIESALNSIFNEGTAPVLAQRLTDIMEKSSKILGKSQVKDFHPRHVSDIDAFRALEKTLIGLNISDQRRTTLEDIRDNIAGNGSPISRTIIGDIPLEMIDLYDSPSDTLYKYLIAVSDAKAKTKLLYGSAEQEGDVETVKNQEARVEKFEGIIEQLNEKLAVVNEELASLEEGRAGTVNDLKETLDAKIDVAIKKLERVKAQETKNIKKARAKLESLKSVNNETLKTLKAKADGIKAKISALESNTISKTNQGKLDSLTKRLKTIEDLKVKLKTHNKATATVKNTAKWKTTFDSLTKRIGKQSELQTKLDDLNATLKKGGEDTTTKLHSELDKVSTQIDSLNTKLANDIKIAEEKLEETKTIGKEKHDKAKNDVDVRKDLKKSGLKEKDAKLSKTQKSLELKQRTLRDRLITTREKLIDIEGSYNAPSLLEFDNDTGDLVENQEVIDSSIQQLIEAEVGKEFQHETDQVQKIIKSILTNKNTPSWLKKYKKMASITYVSGFRTMMKQYMDIAVVLGDTVNIDASTVSAAWSKNNTKDILNDWTYIGDGDERIDIQVSEFLEWIGAELTDQDLAQVDVNGDFNPKTYLDEWKKINKSYKLDKSYKKTMIDILDTMGKAEGITSAEIKEAKAAILKGELTNKVTPMLEAAELYLMTGLRMADKTNRLNALKHRLAQWEAMSTKNPTKLLKHITEMVGEESLAKQAISDMFGGEGKRLTESSRVVMYSILADKHPTSKGEMSSLATDTVFGKTVSTFKSFSISETRRMVDMIVTPTFKSGSAFREMHVQYREGLKIEAEIKRQQAIDENADVTALQKQYEMAMKNATYAKIYSQKSFKKAANGVVLYGTASILPNAMLRMLMDNFLIAIGWKQFHKDEEDKYVSFGEAFLDESASRLTPFIGTYYWGEAIAKGDPLIVLEGLTKVPIPFPFNIGMDYALAGIDKGINDDEDGSHEFRDVEDLSSLPAAVRQYTTPFLRMGDDDD